MPARDTTPAGAPVWVDLMTSDIDRSRAFYTALFGWEATEPNEEMGGYMNYSKDGVFAFYRDVFGWDIYAGDTPPEFRYATLGEGENGQAGIMDSSSFLPEGVPAHWRVYFGTADVDATIDKAVGLGATVIQPADD